MYPFNFASVDPSWKECLQQGLMALDQDYLNQLEKSTDWLPGPEKIFNAFSLPIHQVNYVLFGESPYPRHESANGYAFWDASVQELWCETGLSKKVNRATSLRNMLKMLLIAEGMLDQHHTAQTEIAKLDKTALVKTNQEFFTNLLHHGFLLLNATPILRETSKLKDARAWHPFMKNLLECLIEKRPQVQFILLGRIANDIDQLLPTLQLAKIYAEHPYNLSFITNPDMIAFFKPLHLLKK